MIRRVAFDTSALGHLIAQRVTRDRFEEALEKHDVRPVLGMSIIQLAIASNVEAVRRDLRALAALGLDRCYAIVDACKVQRAEVKERGQSGIALYDGALQIFHATHDPDVFARHLEDQRPVWIRNLRRSLADLHEEALERWRATPTQQRKATAKQIGGEEIHREVLSLDDGSFLRHVLAVWVSEEFSTDVAATPRRYRSHLANGALLVTNMLANIMGSENKPEKYRWLKRGDDDRNDQGIAVDAAYADVLVTDDKGLRGRLDLLRERDLIFFEPMSLAELLG